MINNTTISKALEELNIDLKQIQEPSISAVVIGLLNLVETVVAENEALKEEVQELKDEISHLKGEQGKPNIKGKNNNKDTNISSENERNDQNSGTQQNHQEKESKSKPKTRNRHAKLPKITIDRVEICPIDKATLPDDAVFKGYQDVTIQDIRIVTDNVKYRRETYYSPSENKNYSAKLPEGVEGQGEFGVGVRSLIPLLKSECNVSEPCILNFLENFGIYTSKTYISTQWTTGYSIFHDEKAEIFAAGLNSSSYQQIDDTGARVDGENHYTHILCNPYYSAFFTEPRKNRSTILDIFRNHAPREFLYNDEAISLFNEFKLSGILRLALDNTLEKQKLYNEQAFEQLLETIHTAKIGPQIRTRIKESCAIAAYHQQTDIPVINILMSDDAPQFKKLTSKQILCWIHDGRHYKKLHPVVKQHQEALDDFLTKYWIYYHKLNDYKESPDLKAAISLKYEFDTLFSTKTEYEDLNKRIQKTLAKKEELLLVLQHPELPLHNNASELAARVQVRHRDVSLHTKSEAGTKIKDTFMTIRETAKKLGVRAYDYIRDRVSGRYKLPSLAKMIRRKSQSDDSFSSGIP